MYPDKHGKHLLADTNVARFPCQQAAQASQAAAATLIPVVMCATDAA